VAGPKTLEHIVDTVIYLEREMNNNYSILRAVKNRFGSINEIGILEMTGGGFIEVVNPSSVFLENKNKEISGSVISCIIEGSRPFLVNIQSLASKTLFGYPQRKASGFDINRLQILSSVVSKRTEIDLVNQDLVLNIVGGLRVNDPALDLAVCMAIASSFLNKVVEKDTIILGEVGLGGEVRNIINLEARLKEAEKLGFKKAIIGDSEVKNKKLSIKKIPNIGDLVSLFNL
jgi:DNA repair protein RadA/Sms